LHCPWRIVCAVALLLISLSADAQAPRAPAQAPSPSAPRPQAPRVQTQAIEIRAQTVEAFDPRDTSLAQFGTLRFRGGLVLTSSSREFGGISAIRMLDGGGRFIALTDKGNWLRARIVLRDGRPIAIADAEVAPILGPDGRPVASRRNWYDTEALADDGGTLYVGIERAHEILRFDYGRDGLRARGQPVGVPPGVKSLPGNRGIECLVVPPKGQPLAGTLIAISERGLDPAGNILGFLIGPQPGTFTVKRNDEFDISDCALMPRGDLLILERRFSWTRGLAIRIRRVPLSRVAPRAVLDGAEIIFADMGYQIDNFEGMAVHRAADGALVLTLISDDNFSPLQRTLLLQFTMVGE
jgi:hypothetical protein